MGLFGIGERPRVAARDDSGDQPVARGVSLLSGKDFAVRGNPNNLPTRPSDHKDSFNIAPHDGGLSNLLGGRSSTARS